MCSRKPADENSNKKDNAKKRHAKKSRELPADENSNKTKKIKNV